MMIIGISGGSCSGKSALADELYSVYPAGDILIIQQDSYYFGISTQKEINPSDIDFDHPNAIDFLGLASDIKRIRDGFHSYIPKYDFITHSRYGFRPVIPPKKIILIEGHLIYCSPIILNLCDLRVFVDADRETRLTRRLNRDVRIRGRKMDEVLKTFNDKVEPAHNMWVLSQKELADLVINGSDPILDNVDKIVSVINQRYI